MPLLGRKLFDSQNLKKKLESDAKVYTIPHTNEEFYTEKEFDERTKLYEQKIWSCQCTGHVNLTHIEASESEINSRKRLSEFDEIWEAPILRVVQHSYSLLDNIILEAYKILMTNLIPGEKVSFVVKKPEKVFDATIVKRYDFDCPSNSNESQDLDTKSFSVNATISPSSDKENKKRQALITDVFKSDTRRSPRKSNFMKDLPIKKHKLKLLPKKYDILLVDENKIVSKVPCENLIRIQKPPGKDIIRLFIRTHAVRLWGGKDKLPWVVDKKMVAKHSLTPHITAEEESRMRHLATVTSAHLSSYDVNNLNFNHVTKTPLTNGTASTTDDDDNLCLAEVKKSGHVKKPSSEVKKRKKSTADKKSKNKLKQGKNKSKSGDNRKPSGMDLFLKRMGKPVVKIHSDDIIIDDDDDDRPLSAHLTASLKSSRKSSTPQKKKQATLLELTKKGGGIKLLAAPSSSKLSSAKPKKTRQPLIVTHLLSLKKEKKFRVHKYKVTVAAACKILSEKQRENLPIEVKDDVMKKWEFEDRKKRFQAMTPEEKRVYLAEERKAKRQSEFPKKQEKFEDLHLPRTVAKALPDFELLGLPENLPNTLFGDVAMICEFLHSYHAILCPKDPSYHKQFNIQSLADAVTAGKIGFSVIKKVVVLLLQLLLADDIAKDYSELDFPLHRIPVTPEISSELTRICLRHHDDDLDDPSETDSNIDVIDTGMSDSTSRHLFEMELYEMNPVEQIEVLSTLAYRVMNTYAVQAYMEDTMMKATTIWNKVVQQGVQRKKEEKEQKQELKDKETESDQKSASNVDQSNVQTQTNGTLPIPSETSDLDIVSRVKQRKLLTEQHRREEAQRKEKERKEQEELLVKQKTLQEREKTKRQLAETRMLAVHVRRRIPLGTDRNHSRYWIFCDGVPGLYVEKGWTGDYIDYCTQLNPDPVPCSPSKSPRKSVDSFDFSQSLNQNSALSPEKSKSLDDDDELPLSHLNSPSKKKARLRRSKEEASWPRPGQNMWMSVDSQEQLDQLIASLSKSGIRESKLHRALEKNYDNIVRSINKKKSLYERVAEPVGRRSSLPADGDELLRIMSIKHMQALVRDACRGSLAEVDEPDVFEQRIATFDTVSQFTAALLEFFDAIPRKFLGHYMTGVSDRRKKTAENAETDNLPERERIKAEKRVEKWKHAVEETNLYSRLCFLISILHNSIKWDLYQHRRISSRRGARKNYVDVVEVNIGEEENNEEEESEESEEGTHRRSSRIKEKKKTRYLKDEEDEESEESEEETHRRSSRIKRKKKTRYLKGENDEEEESEESDEETDEETHRKPSRIKEKKKTRYLKEEESDDSEDYEERRRSSKVKRKRKSAFVDEELPVKRSRKKPARYQLQDSEEEDDDDEADEKNSDAGESYENSEQASGDDDEKEEVEVEEDDDDDDNDDDNDDDDDDDDDDDEATICRNIIEKLMKYQYTEFFRDPVDSEEVPDYYDIVTHPMCLSDILAKIEGSDQENPGKDERNPGYGLDEILDDMRLLLNNASLYNAKDSFVMKQAAKLENAFVRLYRDSVSDASRIKRLRGLFRTASR